MSEFELPARPSLDFLKRRAKERLAELRREDPDTKLTAAQLRIAREYCFASWRALKAEIDRRRAPAVAAYFAACANGDAATLRALLTEDASLVHARDDHGSTGLHRAVRHLDCVRVLLDHGADPNARDRGDNATPLHFAGAFGVDLVRLLLDAGADPQGEGDAHELDVIGWCTCFPPVVPWDIVNLLVERGARHHVFSAIACADRALIRRVVETDSDALRRRLSRHEGSQSALHYVIAPPDGLGGGGFRDGTHYPLLDELIALGADLEAVDAKGRTPLALAMLRGDEEAMRRLRAAGAEMPRREQARSFEEEIARLRRSVGGNDAMLKVSDMKRSVAWYQSIGFVLEGTNGEDGIMNWAGLRLGGTFIMLIPAAFIPGSLKGEHRDASFWIRTSSVDALYQAFKQRQLDRAGSKVEGRASDVPEARFKVDLHDTFYGEREFTIVDPDGYELTFAQSIQGGGGVNGNS